MRLIAAATATLLMSLPRLAGNPVFLVALRLERDLADQPPTANGRSSLLPVLIDVSDSPVLATLVDRAEHVISTGLLHMLEPSRMAALVDDLFRAAVPRHLRFGVTLCLTQQPDADSIRIRADDGRRLCDVELACTWDVEGNVRAVFDYDRRRCSEQFAADMIATIGRAGRPLDSGLPRGHELASPTPRDSSQLDLEPTFNL
jgi:hypothetical protein